MATKKKATSPARKKKAPAVPAASAMEPQVQAPVENAKPANWKFIVGLLVVAFLVTKVWDMRYWQNDGFSFHGFSKTESITAVFKGAVAERGEGPNNVLGCLAVAIDPSGSVYYLYGAGTVKKFSPDNKLVAIYDGSKTKEKIAPWSLAPLPDGTLWASERTSPKLHHFDAKLRLIKTIDTEASGINSLVIDSQGRFIATVVGGYVQVLDPQGKLLYDVGRKSKKPLVQGTRLTVDDKDNIYVLDQLASSGNAPEDPIVRSFDKEGKQLNNWTARGLPWNMFSCIAYDPQGYIALNNNGVGPSQGVQLYSKDGKLMAYVPTASNGGSLSVLSGLAISSNGDWAADVSPAGRGCDRLRLPAPEKR